MPLEEYRAKRRFDVTSEPEGKAEPAPGMRFVVQKHDATRLHYDLRLEWEGVLLSWAVTRGPSLDPAEKRLAVQVEDHPLDYHDFEDTIPKGEYGAGSVIVWDRGTWKPVHDAAKGLRKGHLEFTLTGEKLTGRWHLVRMQRKSGEKRDNWLLIKGEDEFARDSGDPDLLDEQPQSVISGRTIEDIGSPTKAPAKPRAKPRKAPKARARILPDFIPPALATLAAKPPVGEDWMHEIKFDGYRLVARVEDGKTRLLTRSGLDWTDRFGPRITDALAALPVTSAMLDGEVVVEGPSGASDFSALQADLSEGRSDRFTFWLFDIIHLDGRDLMPLPLDERKATLQPLIPDAADGPLRYSGEFDEAGDMVLRHACRLSLEGIVSKRRDAPYRSGRSRVWIKSKCASRQEFVIGGYTPSTTLPQAIGSLILGVFEDGALVHVGRVGTGFTHAIARDVFARLETIRQDDSPFASRLTAAEARDAIFVRPELVAEVEYRAWTADGHLRHAAFRGLREDKVATEVVRESPSKPAASPEKPARRRVALTHPDRVYWPDAGVTKEGLADYYAEIWPRIAPHIVGRPLALLRCPEGITGQQFFQKHTWKGARKDITLIRDPSDRPSEPPLVGVNDLDGLLGLVQAAVLEIHPWGAPTADLDRPDIIVMDLDPGEGVDWDRVKTAALELRERLTEAGLAPFLKTSGGKGLHVVAPLVPKAQWPAIKAFTKGMAEAMAHDAPEDFVATIAKSKRTGRILVDYLRNQRGATAVAPYSSRARAGAPVAMPLDWDDLADLGAASQFTVTDAPQHIAAQSADPWADFRRAAKPLPTPKRKR
jgi:bifunctional non-homologous end joining protein LigD